MVRLRPTIRVARRRNKSQRVGLVLAAGLVLLCGPIAVIALIAKGVWNCVMFGGAFGSGRRPVQDGTFRSCGGAASAEQTYVPVRRARGPALDGRTCPRPASAGVRARGSASAGVRAAAQPQQACVRQPKPLNSCHERTLCLTSCDSRDCDRIERGSVGPKRRAAHKATVSSTQVKERAALHSNGPGSAVTGSY